MTENQTPEANIQQAVAMAKGQTFDQTQAKPIIEVADAQPPDYSDEALALRFARLHGDRLRYIAAWSQWYVWTGARWKLELTYYALDLARAICRAASSNTENKAHTQAALASAKTVAAVERLAKTDRRIAAIVDQWDEEPDLFNTEAISPGHDGGEIGE